MKGSRLIGVYQEGGTGARFHGCSDSGNTQALDRWVDWACACTQRDGAEWGLFDAGVLGMDFLEIFIVLLEEPALRIDLVGTMASTNSLLLRRRTAHTFGHTSLPSHHLVVKDTVKPITLSCRKDSICVHKSNSKQNVWIYKIQRCSTSCHLVNCCSACMLENTQNNFNPRCPRMSFIQHTTPNSRPA